MRVRISACNASGFHSQIIQAGFLVRASIKNGFFEAALEELLWICELLKPADDLYLEDDDVSFNEVSLFYA